MKPVRIPFFPLRGRIRINPAQKTRSGFSDGASNADH
jgi:hypothetical protein